MALEPWQELRRRRRNLLWASLAGLVLFAAGIPAAKALGTEKALYAGLILGLIVLVWGMVPVNAFVCPRCGQPFIHNGRRRDAFTKRCLHCRQPLR
jgi:hypothetical protein